MDTMSAFAMGMANAGKDLMVFDWDKAARLIKENNPKCAGAGLRGDWEWTGGLIFEEGNPVKDDCTFLSSTWAVPELDMDGDRVPCFVMASQNSGWGADTKWPDSSLAILNGEEIL